MVPEIFTSGEDLTLRGETFTGEGQVQIGWWSQENGFKGLFVWRKIYCGCGCDSVPQPTPPTPQNPPSQTCELRPTLPQTHEKRPPDCSDGLVSITISPKDRGSCGKRFRFPQGTLSRSIFPADPSEPCRVLLHHEPFRVRCRGLHPGCSF